MNAFKTIARYSLVALAAGFIYGCNKDDTTAPVITVNGDNPYTLEMLATYVDPGASANDDEDGDISSSIIVDASGINNKLPGSYSVFYSVTDAAGNEGTNSRTVIVAATTNALAKSYNVVDTCTVGGSSAVYTYTQTVSAVNSTQIGFNKFADYSGNTGITASVNANGTMSLPSQDGLDIGTASEDHTFQGSGVVTENGFVLTYTDRNNSAVPVSTANCKAYFTRQ
jgi:hypothetical protein